jgi:cytidylate kinase
MRGMKKHVITLGGMPGSGKSSTGKALSALLGYERCSSGDFFRELAAQRGVSVEELNRLGESDQSIDHETDAWVRQKGEQGNLIIDSRMAFHWIPEAFNVFLKLDPKIAAERTYAHIKNEGRTSQSGDSVEDVYEYENTLVRMESEKKRYVEMYGVDYTDESHYDLVVDTGPNNVEQVTKLVADAYQKWLAE